MSQPIRYETIETYPYRPTYVFEDVGHIPVEALEQDGDRSGGGGERPPI